MTFTKKWPQATFKSLIGMFFPGQLVQLEFSLKREQKRHLNKVDLLNCPELFKYKLAAIKHCMGLLN